VAENCRKRLKKAWKEYNQVLKEKNVTLPTDDTGRRRDSKGRGSRMIYTENIDMINVDAQQQYRDDASNTACSQEAKFRELLSPHITSESILHILIMRLLYKHTYKRIAKDLSFSGGSHAIGELFRTTVNRLSKIKSLRGMLDD